MNVLPNNATNQEVSDFFNSADTDADGFLTKDEIKTAFTGNGQTLTDAELDAAFTKADSDADGKLSLQELKKFLVPEVPETPPTDPVTPTEPEKNET